MIFLGTGAAEFSPNPFCNCESCARARREGALPRKRSALMLDERNIVDFGPDVMSASQQYNSPFYELENIFVTHTHEDHFAPTSVDVLTMTPFRKGHPLCIYMSEKALEWISGYIAALDPLYAGGKSDLRKLTDNGMVLFVPVKPYTTFTAGGMQVFTVESNHHANGKDEYAINYLFTRPDGKKIIYAADTGLYGARNLEVLSGSGADYLVMEGTHGSRELAREAAHLNAEHFIVNVHAMLDNNIIKKDATVFATHICSVGNVYNHEEYQVYLDKNCKIKVTVAHDGMKVDL